MYLTVVVGESGADKFLWERPVIKAEGHISVNCEFAAVIAGKGAELEVRSALGVIVDESFRTKIPRGIQLITCGISPKNTVSVTSRTAGRLTLSLNRGIRTVSGICEPLEQPVDVPENADEFDVMAAFAARVLTGLRIS
ncbi:MAG: hypothetical protein HDT43_07820 [Ruminococcaceae bacterium]|nr:hypothetical protein [Oscillospiraceae bacterium]